ncbi:MAG: hypothetical protein ACOC8E_01510 [Planctomycetota bacterium]
MPEDRLQRLCDRFRGRLRRMLVQYGVLSTIAIVLVVAGALMFADWYFRFSPDMRRLSLLTLVAVTGICAYFCLYRPLRSRWTDEEVLLYMDRVLGGDDALTAFRDLSHPEGMREWDTERGKEMVRASVRELEQKVGRAHPGRLLRRGPVRRWWGLAGFVVAAYVAACIGLRDPASGEPYPWIGARRILFPSAVIFWPQNTHILVREPEAGWRVPVGEPLVVRAQIDGVVPRHVDIVYRSESSDLWLTERMALNPAEAEAEFSFSEMTESLTFYCIGGDDREKRTYRVTVAERPIITAIRATYVYPRYTRLPTTIRRSGQLAGPEGTRVTLDFTASIDLSEATVQVHLDGEEPGRPVAVDTLDGSRFSHSLTLTRSGTCAVHLVDTEGLTNARLERYEVRVAPDNPPEITLEKPLRDLILTARGKVRVEFKAEDDYNLTELQVLIAPEGGRGEPLSEERITGPFWDRSTTLHPVGDGDFDLDFLRVKDKGIFKKWNIDQGAELELWVRAVDCNPTRPGITETPRVRLSVLHPTDFMSEVLLKTKMLMTDARVGWFHAAGAFHDGTAWVASPEKRELLKNIVEQQQTAERAASALALRFPEMLDHMTRNRMSDVFMSKRLADIGSLIAELEESLPAIGGTIAEARPKSLADAAPPKRRARMVAAVRSVLPAQNRAAWKMRLLYNRLADWVALQSVLLKTRRMEELQVEVNRATRELVRKTLGREARELDETEVREMKEVANQQETVYEMAVAVEKALARLVQQADQDGRKKIFDALGRALLELRDNRVQDKLKRASLVIADARGDIVRDDQLQVLRTLTLVNRGLILAGEQVPADPSRATLAAAIEDPRDKTDIDEGIDSEAVVLDEGIYKKLDQVRLVAEAKADTLDETLALVFRDQEDVRNRTRFVADRLSTFPRYVFLRTGLTAYRQGRIVELLEKGLDQTKTLGEESGGAAEQNPSEPDPTVDRARTRLASELTHYLAGARDARALIAESRFDRFVTGIQSHVHRGARNLGVYIQAREKLHKLWLDRKSAEFEDSFGQPYLLRQENLETMVEAARNLEWALALQAGSKREAALLAEAKRTKKKSARLRQAVERITESARRKNVEIAQLIRRVHGNVSGGVEDPTDPERSNEKVLPTLKEQVLEPLPPDAFAEAANAFGAGDYETLAMKQETLRRELSDALVALYDLFETRVPQKPPTFDPFAEERGVAEAKEGLFIEYADETPEALADRLEEEGAWIDARTGDPEVRKRLIERLRGMSRFDARYARLQSAYLQAVAQRFQAKAKKESDEKDEEEEE